MGKKRKLALPKDRGFHMSRREGKKRMNIGGLGRGHSLLSGDHHSGQTEGGFSPTIYFKEGKKKVIDEEQNKLSRETVWGTRTKGMLGWGLGITQDQQYLRGTVKT